MTALLPKLPRRAMSVTLALLQALHLLSRQVTPVPLTQLPQRKPAYVCVRERESISHKAESGIILQKNTIFHLTLSVASALPVSLGQVLRHSEPALCIITGVPRLAAAVTTGTACGDQDLGTI